MQVMTAVALILADGTEHTFVEETTYYLKMSRKLIEAYVKQERSI